MNEIKDSRLLSDYHSQPTQPQPSRHMNNSNYMPIQYGRPDEQNFNSRKGYINLV